ncbi:HpcH/HpaI aldolase/citrate lyase family protein [Methylorubrum salsuginis]|uniref:HpcH/HpaI aldolase/citrate lyase family protein n=1 Tax=Methylorubrum salsuginis TaxID=414703 RepID=A0A1I3ZR84_9HYPH|nr:HpcH/HpaI aldolase/citrate lyase family protein [Methylorubrum salsuginis]
MRVAGAVDALVVEGPLPPGLRGRIGPKRLILALDRPDAPLPAEAPDAVLLAARSGRDVAALGARLAVHEAEHGWPDGRLRILAAIADPLGVLEARGFVGASPRLDGLGFDGAALAASLGTDPAGETVAQARALVRLAAAAAGVTAFATLEPGGLAGAAAGRDSFDLLIARDPGALTPFSR